MQSPSEMPGGVLLRKAKARIYPEVLKDAETSLSAKEHDGWIAGLVERLETAPSAYSKRPSDRNRCFGRSQPISVLGREIRENRSH